VVVQPQVAPVLMGVGVETFMSLTDGQQGGIPVKRGQLKHPGKGERKRIALGGSRLTNPIRCRLAANGETLTA